MQLCSKGLIYLSEQAKVKEKRRVTVTVPPYAQQIQIIDYGLSLTIGF